MTDRAEADDHVHQSTLVVLAMVGVATIAFFQGFEVFDWESGVVRFFLLVGVGALCLSARLVGTRSSPALAPPSRTAVKLAVVGVAVLTGYRLLLGVDAALDVSRGGQVDGDQGPNIHAALRLLERGENPYGTNAVVDIVELESLVTSREAARCLVGPPSESLAAMKRFYTTFDASLMPRVDVASSSACADFAARARALGFKYGPLMIAAHAAGLSAGGAAGMQWTNLVLFAVLIALTFTLAWKYSVGTTRWIAATLACAIVVAPTIVLRCAVRATDADLLPTVLVLGALLCLEHRRTRLGASFVALSLGTKLLPGLLFVPLLMPASSTRSRPASRTLAAVVVVIYLPFVLWDPGGLWANYGRFNFVRASDSTSIVHFVPTTVSRSMLVAVLIVLTLLYRRIARHGWTARARLDFVLAAHLGVLATGPILHNNYLIWLLPVVALYLACETSRWIETSGPPASRPSTTSRERMKYP